MADFAIERRLAVADLRSTAVEWVLAHRAVVALVGLMAIAAALRFWAVDVMALHHDESLHAQYTWYLYSGDGYKHDPLMHGPFLFHSGALVFFLFGDGDYTIRVLPALFGTALVGMPFLLRKHLGMKTVLIAAVLLTFSPTLLYFSRFYRNDIYIAVWTMGMVICIWRYLDELKPRYLYILAALLALSFATKEVTFITAAIMLVFVNAMLAIDLARGETEPDPEARARQMRLRRRPEAPAGESDWLGKAVLLLPVAWLVAAFWPLLGKRPFGRDGLPATGDVLIVLGTLVLPQFAAAVQVLPFVGNDGYNVDSESTLRVTTVLVLLILSAYVGLLWRPKVWAIAAAAFFIPFVLLYTTFFTNQPAIWTEAFWRGQGGFWSGIWGSLDYWLDQHHVKRGNQPLYYYGLVTPLYEFLPLLIALGGAAWIALKGDSLRRWLLFWLGAIFVGLSIAGEKMPWLEVHIALPLALVAAIVLAGAIDRLGFSGRDWLVALGVALPTAAGTLLLVEGSDSPRMVGAVLVAAVLGWLATSFFTAGRLAFARALLVFAVAALFTLTARAGITAAFVNEDTPVEMLVYTQTSHDVPVLRDRIDALAAASGLGYNLPVVVDPQDGFSWPWAWYLRDYHDLTYADPSSENFRPAEGAVLLVSRAHAPNVTLPGYSQTPYKHRWWFVESYRELTASKVASTLTHWDSLKSLGDFFLHRRPAVSTTGSTDAVAFFPDSLAAFDVKREAPKPPPEPSTLSDGRIVFGRPGSARGELNQPAGLAVDAEGNLWVAEARNARLQKFDAAGNILEAVGRGGAAPGTFSEPWGVAVGPDGYIYVADTWNHRIQRFSPDLQDVTTWGQPSAQDNPSLLQLFGPRDIAFAADGTLWVSDTGNKRLIHYTPDGEPIEAFGVGGAQLGQFSEPVGISLDASGRFYVADTWNGRIQRFDAGFTNPVAFDTGWQSQDIIAKPYIAVLADGRIVATEPTKGALLLLSAEGQPAGVWRPEADSQPLGVVALPNGGFAFSDARRGEVQIVPAAAIDSLFR